MELIISRASIVNRCNSDGKLHLFMTEEERPCKEAVLKEILDNDGTLCSRFMIHLDTVEDIDKLGEKYNVDVLVTRNTEFNNYIAVLLYDEEIVQEFWLKEKTHKKYPCVKRNC